MACRGRCDSRVPGRYTPAMPPAAGLECPDCLGDGLGTIVSTRTGEARPAPWACGTCRGTGRLPYKDLARTSPGVTELDELEDAEASGGRA
jgi:hypothetical protein